MLGECVVGVSSGAQSRQDCLDRRTCANFRFAFNAGSGGDSIDGRTCERRPAAHPSRPLRVERFDEPVTTGSDRHTRTSFCIATRVQTHRVSVQSFSAQFYRVVFWLDQNQQLRIHSAAVRFSPKRAEVVMSCWLVGTAAAVPMGPLSATAEVVKARASRPLTDEAAVLPFEKLNAIQIPPASGRTEAVDAIATRELSRWHSDSVEYNLEFGSSICPSLTGRGGFLVPPPETSAPREADEVKPATCPGTIARIHTHGRFGMRGPSGYDIGNADALPDVVFYVGTPCNSIHSWKGPRSSENQSTLRGCTP